MDAVKEPLTVGGPTNDVYERKGYCETIAGECSLVWVIVSLIDVVNKNVAVIAAFSQIFGLFSGHH